MKPLPVWFLLWFSTTLCAAAVVHEVSNAAEFNRLPSTLNAGDVVLLRDGTYEGLDRTFTSSIATDAQALESPVVIRAETPGGVVVSGPTRLRLRGSGIHLSGIDFGPGSGGLGTLLSLDPGSRHMRLSHLRFRDCSPESVRDVWLNIQGFNHIVEYCSFSGKRSANAVITVRRHAGEPGPDVPRNHHIRYCYFGQREASASNNGYETIRIGDSSSQIYLLSTTVENCVFERSIWRADGRQPNDPEIISNKSRGNRYLSNTFLECTGQLTLRHGDACLVEGNFFLGAGRYSEDGKAIVFGPPNPHQAGVRIIGQDHVVQNNLFMNLGGTNFRAALCLMAGARRWNDGDGSSGDNGYEAADGALIRDNTFIDCLELHLGFAPRGDRQPAGVRILGNHWQSTVSGSRIVRNPAFTPAGSDGNRILTPGDPGWSGLGGTHSRLAASQPPPLPELPGMSLEPGSGQASARENASHRLSAILLRPTGNGPRPLLRHEVGASFDR